MAAVAGGSKKEAAPASARSSREADLVVNVKYRNTLPPLPFAPKFLPSPLLPDRYAPL
jgi:hypothetical protein